MSDHEDGGHDDWEAMSLPGGVAYSVSSRRGTESLVDAIIPTGPNGTAQTARLPPAKRSQPQVEASYRPQVQALTQGITHRPGGIQHRPIRPIAEPKVPVNNEGYRIFVRGDKAMSHHDLTITWGKFMRNLPSSPAEPPERVARIRLDEICRRTNAYIPTPDADSVHVEVWARDEEVAVLAVRELQTFEHITRQTGPRPNREVWKTTRTFDGRVEDRAVRKDMQAQLSAARIDANRQTHFQYQAYLLWPTKVDMTRFRKRHEETTLKDIQGSMNMPCSIDFIEEGVKYVRISAGEERHIHSLHLRMINLIKDTVAQNGLFSCINRLRLPRAPAYRDRVGLDKHPTASYFIPTIHGDKLPEIETEKWESLCKQCDRHNRLILRNEMEAIIQGIHAPGQQVRIRLTFTELGFRVSTTPANGSDSHTFDDFCEMLREPQTMIAPGGLLPAPSVNFGDLVQNLEAMPEFSNLETRFTLHFDFAGTSRSTLRLEREMYIGIHGDLESSANRWLQFSDSIKDNEVLEFNMLDFEHPRANYQVHIGKTNIYEPASSEKRLLNFSHNVSYAHDPDGLRAAPRRRAVFPPGYHNLSRHVEITIARFNFKGPDARLDLLRKDSFDANAASGSLPSRTEWYAHYYYPEWDSLLGEFSNLKPGDQVTWPRSMNTFFIPLVATEDNRPLPRTFAGFMNEAEQVQEILQNAIEQLEREVDMRNVQDGIGGMQVG